MMFEILKYIPGLRKRRRSGGRKKCWEKKIKFCFEIKKVIEEYRKKGMPL